MGAQNKSEISPAFTCCLRAGDAWGGGRKRQEMGVWASEGLAAVRILNNHFKITIITATASSLKTCSAYRGTVLERNELATPILQTRKLRPKSGNCLAQSHTAGIQT